MELRTWLSQQHLQLCPQANVNTQTSLASMISVTGKNISSLKNIRVSRGFLSALMKKADEVFRSAFSPLVIAMLVPIFAHFVLFHAYDLILIGVVDVLLLIRGPGKWNRIFPMDTVHRSLGAGPKSDMHSLVALPIAVFMLVFCLGEALEAIIATLSWYWSAAREEGRKQVKGELRYLKHRPRIEDGENNVPELQDQIWKPYKIYLSSRPRDVLEAVIDDNLPDVCDAEIDSTRWPVVTSSRTFKDFVDCVRDVAIPTFFSASKRLISEGLVGGEDRTSKAGKMRLLRSLAEVQWCFMQTRVAPTINISTSASIESFRPSNILKLRVEAISRSEWQWWPLQPPGSRRRAKDTECHISWKCVSCFSPPLPRAA